MILPNLWTHLTFHVIAVDNYSFVRPSYVHLFILWTNKIPPSILYVSTNHALLFDLLRYKILPIMKHRHLGPRNYDIKSFFLLDQNEIVIE